MSLAAIQNTKRKSTQTSKTCYRFARCQVHPDFCDIQGWFLEVKDNDQELLGALYKSIKAKYASILGQDSHGCDSRQDNASLQASLWLDSLEAELLDGPVLVNPAGGIAAKRDLIVLAEVKRKELIWPVHYVDEIITISRWPKGKHYYLCSNQSRLFVPEKYNNYNAARKAAMKYVDTERIRMR
jgi:hypothetical protein